MISFIKRNKIFRMILYYLFKKRYKISKLDRCNYFESYQMDFPFKDYVTTEFEEVVNFEFNRVSNSGEEEYVIKYTEGVWIEPNNGYAINYKSEILLFSQPYGCFGPIPAIPEYIYYKRYKSKRLNEAVVVNYNWNNYWHFHNDIMG